METLQAKVITDESLKPSPIPRSHGELPCFETAPHNTYSPLAWVRLEILLVKEAEQRSGDDIHPRIDRQLLGSDKTFGHYETLRCIMIEYILTVCWTPPLFCTLLPI